MAAALLLGVKNGICVNRHGSSKASWSAAGLRLAHRAASHGVMGRSSTPAQCSLDCRSGAVKKARRRPVS